MDEKKTEIGQQARVVEGRYFVIVTALMLLIIILLGWLWMRERRAATGARQDLLDLRRVAGANVIGAQKLQSMLAGSMRRPLQRDDLPMETVTWNGRPRQVFRVSAAAGARLGLEPNDVVLVNPAPPAEATTAPQTQEAGP